MALWPSISTGTTSCFFCKSLKTLNLRNLDGAAVPSDFASSCILVFVYKKGGKGSDSTSVAPHHA